VKFYVIECPDIKPISAYLVTQGSMEQVSSEVNPSYNSETESRAVCEVPTEYAITVRHAKIQYKDSVGTFLSRSKSIHVVLKDFNMTVQKGHM